MIRDTTIFKPDGRVFVLPFIFGDAPEVLILDIFLENPDYLFTLEAVKDASGITGEMDAHTCLIGLTQNDIIYTFGYDGNVEIFKLKSSNKIVKILLDLRRVIEESKS